MSTAHEHEAQRPMRADARENLHRILGAARERFAVAGLAVSVNDIAAHAGVGVGTLYRRFPHKQDLVDAVFASALDEMVDTAQRAAGSASGWNGLVTYLGAVCDQVLSDRALRELVFAPGLTGTHFGDIHERLRPPLELLVARAHDEGLLRPDVTAEDIPPLLHMLGEIGPHLRDIPGMSLQRYLGIVVDGLRARPDTTPLGAPPTEGAIAAFMSRRSGTDSPTT
ncbi:TetR/AcrR family transcriptional regulator [Kocuria rosea]|uniref:TetR/AcrR family transcriptional regulator n=1 Tax=Kocuria rosea TaxID=1275 RepID=UPI00140E310A|nr:TetR/AcrR family transcriptional regulator [Kocuria rosea]